MKIHVQKKVIRTILYRIKEFPEFGWDSDKKKLLGKIELKLRMEQAFRHHDSHTLQQLIEQRREERRQALDRKIQADEAIREKKRKLLRMQMKQPMKIGK